MVGRALADRLSALGNDVVIGTRDVEQARPSAHPLKSLATWRDSTMAERP